MKKYILIGLSVALLGAMLAVAIYKYDSRPVSHGPETLQQAVQARRAAQQTLREHDAVNAVTLTHANMQIMELSNQKVVLCNQIKAAKLSQALCL